MDLWRLFKGVSEPIESKIKTPVNRPPHSFVVAAILSEYTLKRVELKRFKISESREREKNFRTKVYSLFKYT
jgi:hypothetical protein